MFNKGKFSRSENPQKCKNPNKITSFKAWRFLQIIYYIYIYIYIYILSNLVIHTFTFRYSLASMAFPKAKYSVLCTEFPVVRNTLNISSITFKMWQALFYVNSLNFQQWNSNLDIVFQFVLSFKIGIFVFEC